MKRLLCAMAIAASATAFAAYEFDYDVVDTNGFEGVAAGASAVTAGFTLETPAGGTATDASFVSNYTASAVSQPSVAAPAASTYGYGDNYLDLNTDSDTLTASLSGAGSTVYVDTFIQFNDYPDTNPELDEGAKLALWMCDSNLYVKAVIDNVTNSYPIASTVDGVSAILDPTAWYRLTVKAAVNAGGNTEFEIFVNGEQYAYTATSATKFGALSDGSVASVGFKGSGKLDNFCAASLYPMANSYAHYFTGSGTSEDPFVVTDADALSELIANGSSYGLTVDGKYFTFSGALPGDVVLADGFVFSYADGKYTIVEGVACLNGTWYASFDAAYDTATGDGTETLLVKISANFAPTLAASKAFSSVTFTTESADPLTIATTYDEYAITAPTWSAPATATLTLASHTAADIASITAGTLVVPAGVTLEIASGSALGSVTSLIGEGTLVAPPNPYYFYVNANTQSLLQNVAWEGTVEFAGNAYATWPFNPNLVKNAGSKIRFNGFSVATLGDSNSSYTGIELVGDGLTLNGDYTRTYTFTTLEGDGTLNVQAMGAGNSYIFINDASGFTGGVTLASATARVVFGDTTTGGGGSITVAAGCNVTNVATATWTASDLIVIGELVAKGTVTISGKLWGDKSTGVYRVENAASHVTPASSWNSTYVIGYGMSGAVNPNNYGNANSTVAFAADLASGAYFGAGSDADYTISPTIRLDTDVSIKNGFSYNDGAASNTVTFTKVTGDHNLATWTNPNAGRTAYYAITTLEDYSGTLVVNNKSSLTIGTVVLASAPETDVCVVPVTLGTSNASINSPAYAVASAGGETGTLEYRKVDGGTDGLYKAAGGSTFDGGDGVSTFTIDAATVTALEAVVPGGDLNATTNGMTYAQAYALGLLDETTGEVSALPAVEITVGPAEISGLTVNAVSLKLASSIATRSGYTVTCKVYKSATLPVATVTAETETLDPAATTSWKQATGTDVKNFYQVKVSIADASN